MRSGNTCSPSCFPEYLGASDYLAPVAGTTTGAMPVFRWNPVAGAESYFVVVARDAAFTTVVDYALTQVPVYAPRRRRLALPHLFRRDDEVLLGRAAVGEPEREPGRVEPPERRRIELPEADIAAGTAVTRGGANVATWPTLRWTPVNGTRVYEIQVADAPTFSSPLDDKITNSTAYTSETTYPADTILYWRVRPLDDERTPLTWSDVRTFNRKLPTAAWDLGLPTSGATTPVLTWAPITGAVSYDLDTDKPDGTHKLWSDLRSAALTYTTFYGTGVFGQRVRANFPSSSGGTMHSPWSTTLNFTRTIPAPDDPATSVGSSGVSFSWSPRPEAREYRVQVSKTTDFARPIETTVNSTGGSRRSTKGAMSAATPPPTGSPCPRACASPSSGRRGRASA